MWDNFTESEMNSNAKTPSKTHHSKTRFHTLYHLTFRSGYRYMLEHPDIAVLL